jgi:hypothetical protein
MFRPASATPFILKKEISNPAQLFDPGEDREYAVPLRHLAVAKQITAVV